MERVDSPRQSRERSPVTAPDGTVTAPEGAVTAPEGAVTAPEGGVSTAPEVGNLRAPRRQARLAETVGGDRRFASHGGRLSESK